MSEASWVLRRVSLIGTLVFSFALRTTWAALRRNGLFRGNRGPMRLIRPELFCVLAWRGPEDILSLFALVRRALTGRDWQTPSDRQN
jgi:hypothetical protein